MGLDRDDIVVKLEVREVREVAQIDGDRHEPGVCFQYLIRRLIQIIQEAWSIN